jgi:hypothetical protein
MIAECASERRDIGAHVASPIRGEALGNKRAAAVGPDEDELCASTGTGGNAVVDDAVAGHADEGDDSCLNTMLEGKCAFVGKGGQALQLRSRMGAN